MQRRHTRSGTNAGVHGGIGLGQLHTYAGRLQACARCYNENNASISSLADESWHLVSGLRRQVNVSIVQHLEGSRCSAQELIQVAVHRIQQCTGSQLVCKLTKPLACYSQVRPS